MVDEAEPRADIGDVAGFWEVLDGVEIFLARSYAVVCDLKSRELHGVFTKFEFCWVKDYPIVTAKVQPLNCLVEARCKVVCL